jgi:hypothetical protein
MDDAFLAGNRFLLSQARLLERRLSATCLFGAPAAGVVDALRGYQNDDGGFGHALEPDKRCPASLPIDVETAFQALAAAGTLDRAMVTRACDFLARAAAEAGAGGAVPLAFPVIESFPRAEHWSEWTYEPGHPDRGALSDPDVVALARAEHRAIVTNNLRDFRPLHHEAITPGGPAHYGMVFVPGTYRRTKADTGKIITALQAILTQYPGENDLANGAAWL